VDPVRAAELAERFRARKARAEAQRDLQRLRTRHWSGERIVEEGRTEIEWWEHPEADPYAVLGLLPGASMEEAAAARRSIANDCHPDRLEHGSGDPDVALRRMVATNAAYDRLRRALHPV
jgi:DnaJ-class molecular chaperone